ncbi:MAG: tRNA lysidine(34) synthetase TilS [Candidatus Korobacteraceae bacterium]
MRSKVLHYIRDRGLMRAGNRICVAVSGGADSVALLRALLELRAELGIVLAVAHFNHQLRGDGSQADEAFVVDLARQHGLEFSAGRADVREHARQSKQSIEAAGRELRYQWLTQLAEEQRVDCIATAHTLDDQAETVLLKFLRGAGTRGLAGIYPELFTDPQNKTRIVRPMLCVTRDEVEAYLSALGQSWREDESNLDHRFARNRVRHELLPLLERNFNPNIRQVLSDTADLSRAEEEYWQALVERELEDRIVAPREKQIPRGLKPARDDKNRTPGGTAEAVPFQPSAALRRLSLANFPALPLALQRRLLRRFAETEGLALDFEHVELLLRCAHGELPKTELAGGWTASRRGECLELRAIQPEPTFAGYECVLPIPGEVQLAEVGLTLRATIVREKFAKETSEPDNLLSAELLGTELTVRNWRSGDRFWPVHSGSEEKLKRLFAGKHIPAEQRPSWPVALSGEQIVWVRGFPVARAFAWSGKGDAVKVGSLGQEG